MSDRHYSEERRKKREKGRKRTEDVRRGWDICEVKRTPLCMIQPRP